MIANVATLQISWTMTKRLYTLADCKNHLRKNEKLYVVYQSVKPNLKSYVTLTF